MFGIGTSELILILVLALLIIGPRELPKIGREIGKAFRSFQDVADELKTSITREIRDIEDTGREIERDINSTQGTKDKKEKD